MAETIKIEARVRLATNADLLIAPRLLKLGQPYYVYCEATKQIEGVFVLDKYTNSQKLQELFLAKKIYVPVIAWDDTIKYKLQQTDLKLEQLYGHNTFENKRPPAQVSD